MPPENIPPPLGAIIKKKIDQIAINRLLKMKINAGDVFRIHTKKGFGFMQYVETSDLGFEYVRIIDLLSETGEISISDVYKLERWNIEFPLKTALRRKIVSKVANFSLPPDYQAFEYARTEHNIRGEFLGWFIVNRKTLQRELKKRLSTEDLKLSPFGVMNDTLIIEYLENDWKLEDWK